MAKVKEPAPIMEPADGGLVTLPELARDLITIPPQGTPLPLCPTNLDMRTMAGRSMMLKMAGPSDDSLRDRPEIRFKAVYWALIPDVAADEETGEMSEFVRTVFMDESGRTFRTTSQHGPMRLIAMLQMFTKDEWQRGIPLVITERRSRRGRPYHDIQVDCSDRVGVV